MKKLILFLVLCISTLGFSQKKQSVTAEIDTTRIRIGEQFHYKISVPNRKDVAFPKLQNLKDLEVISENEIDTFPDKLEKKYVLTGFESGHFYISKQEVFVDNKSYFTDSLLIHIATVQVDTIKQPPFAIKPLALEPYVLDDFKPYFIWLWVLLGVLLLGGIAIYVYKKYFTEDFGTVKETIPPFQEAISKLSTLDEMQLWQNNKTKEFYVELAEIVRSYIGKEVNLHTLEATTNELIEMISMENKSKNIGITRETISEIEAFLKQADYVKFAKLRPIAEEIRQDRSAVESILKTLQPTINQYKQVALEEDSEAQLQKIALKKEALEKKKKTFKYAAIAILVLLLLFVGFQMYRVTKQVFGGGIPASTEVTQTENEADWQEQSFGNPALSLHAPFQIPLEINEVPVKSKNVLSELQVYGYNDSASEKIISVSFSSYKNQPNVSIDKVLLTSIQNLESLADAEGFEYERQPANLKNGMKGVFILGLMQQKGVEKEFKIVGFSNKNKVWQVITVCNLDDTSSKKMFETIIDSINIETV